MDLWEAAYNMDNFVCFFNKEEQELSTIKTPAGDNFLEKWKEVSSERVKILKRKYCTIVFVLSDNFLVIKEEF